MNKLLLYGASGHGKVVAEIAEENGFQIDYFIDRDTSKLVVFNYEVRHILPKEPSQMIISIGNNAIRRTIISELKNWIFPVLIHPKANLSRRIKLGEGSVIMAGVTMNANVSIGNHCIINTNCSVDHDCVLEDFVHLSPNVALAGEVRIGEGSHIGIGASIIPGVNIGKWCTIGAGAVILHDVPDGATVVGNPGRKLK